MLCYGLMNPRHVTNARLVFLMFLAISVVLAVSGCQSSAPQATSEATLAPETTDVSPAAPTNTLRPTSSPSATATPLPSATALATEEAKATSTTEAQPTKTPRATAIRVEPAVTPVTATPSSDPAATGPHPDDLRTGITGLDAVLDAIASRDPQAIAGRMQALSTPCMTVEGLGGPPRCDGLPEGTVVTVFPLLGAEGTFAPEENMLDVAQRLEIAGLFGIYQVTTGPSAEEAYWPSGEYGVVLVGSGQVPAYTLIVQGDRIVRIVYHLGASPEEAFDSGRGNIVIPPLK